MPFTRTNFTPFAVWQDNKRARVRRDDYIQIKLPTFDLPRRFRKSVRSNVSGVGVRESTARAWMNFHTTVTRLGRSQTADRPVHPIRYGTKRIMIEGCHFS